METDISLNNVSFAYKKQPILENVTLTIPHREFASIVGPNGGGKTTLLKLLLGLIPRIKATYRCWAPLRKKPESVSGICPSMPTWI